MILITGLLVIMAAIAGNCDVQPSPGTTVSCTNSARLHPDPMDCRKFYRCVNRKLVPMSCPPKTVFDRGTQICDWRQDTNNCTQAVPEATTRKSIIPTRTPITPKPKIGTVKEVQDNINFVRAKITPSPISFTTASVQQRTRQVYPGIEQEKSERRNNKSDRTGLDSKLDTNQVAKRTTFPVTAKSVATSSSSTSTAIPTTIGLNKWYHKMNEPAPVVRTPAPSSGVSRHNSSRTSHHSEPAIVGHVTKVSSVSNTSSEINSTTAATPVEHGSNNTDNKVPAESTSRTPATTKGTSSDSLGSATNRSKGASPDTTTSNSVSLKQPKGINAAAESNVVDLDVNINTSRKMRSFVTGSEMNTVSTVSHTVTAIQHDHLVGSSQITSTSANIATTSSMIENGNATETKTSTGTTSVMENGNATETKTSTGTTSVMENGNATEIRTATGTTSVMENGNATETKTSTDTTSVKENGNAAETKTGTGNTVSTLQTTTRSEPEQGLNRNESKVLDDKSSGTEGTGNTSVPFDDLDKLIVPYKARVNRKPYKIADNMAKDSLEPQAQDIKYVDVRKDQIWSELQIPDAMFAHMTAKIVNRDIITASPRNEKARPRWYDPQITSSKINNIQANIVTPSMTTSITETTKVEPSSGGKDDYIETVRFENVAAESPIVSYSRPETATSRGGDEIAAMAKGERSIRYADHEPIKHNARMSSGDLTDNDLDSLLRTVNFIGTSQPEPAQAGDMHLDVNFMSAPYLVTGLYRHFHCPQLDGHFPDPKNCAVYYHCTRGQAYRRDCPAGQVFHPGVQSCVTSKLAPPCTSAYSASSQEDESPKSSVCKKPDGLFRDSLSCSHYFECTDGAPIRRRCLMGTVFDDVVGKCSWSKFVPGCEQKANVKTEMAISAKNRQSHGRSSFQCPRDGYFRDPESCDVYYLCVGSVTQRMTCDPETSFDMTLNMCVWTHLVDGCKSRYNNVLNEAAEDSSLMETRDQRGAPKTSFLRKPSVQHVTDYKCTEANGVFPDNTNCSVYYRCADGVATSWRCPDGLGFDGVKGFCTDKSRCVTKKVDDARGIRSDHIVSAPFTCPEAHGLYSDPNHCSFFIHCFKKVAYRHQCQPGTVFSTKHAACTWRELVDECQDQEPAKLKAPLEKLMLETARHSKEAPQAIETAALQHRLSPSETANYKVQPVGLQEFKCPTVDDGFYRDSLFCDIFHRCVVGNKFTFTCPAGTFFRLEDNLCDFWDTVKDCTQDGLRVEAMGKLPKVVPSPGPIQVLQPHPEQFDDVSVVGIDGDPTPCPAASGLFPHPRNCHQFLFCTHFVPLVLTCPESLLYNPLSLTCDFPKKVQCLRYDDYTQK